MLRHACPWSMLLALLSLLLVSGCEKSTTVGDPDTPGSAAAGSDAAAPQTADAQARKTPALIRARDRLLFVGDEVTQQMFYPRATMVGLMSTMPRAGLRYFNGGMDGATARSAATWTDDLLTLTKPTVVFFCFGLNESESAADDATMVRQYKASLKTLVKQARQQQGVRMVVLLSPPAVPGGASSSARPSGQNARLEKLALACHDVATELDVTMIDLFGHMYATYGAANDVGTDLAFGGRLPTESGHVVLASIVLRGLGVRPADLERVHWAPIKATRMGTVRAALALPLPRPDAAEAERSYYAYLSHQKYDELFFRAWRLAGRGSQTESREQAMRQADDAWQAVAEGYRQAYDR